MTAKIIQFPIRALKLKREVLLPGKLYFDWERPEAALADLYTLYNEKQISKKIMMWAHKQIMDRLETYNAADTN